MSPCPADGGAPAGAAAGRLRVTALATHPIQYQAPWFRRLAARGDVDLEVLFEHLPDPHAQGEGFGRAFRWDQPLLEGYDWQALSPPGGARRLLAAAHALRRRLRARRPQVVLLTGWQSPVLLAAPGLARGAGAAVLVRGESNLHKPRPPWVRAAHRALLRRYDVFLAIGSANRDFYGACGVAPSRIVDCPYFVDNEWFGARALGLDRAEQRRRFGVPPNATCVLFAGKLEAKKRPLDAVHAVSRAHGAPVHLLVAGSGALEARLRREAAGLPVSFAGFLNQGEMPAAYAAADCLVLPSDHGETWGLVVNEAMACGLPAIVSDQVGCASDLVLPGRTGWRHPVGDVAALARCIGEAARDPGRLEAMGAHARQHVADRCSVERGCEAVVEASRLALAGWRAR